MIDVYVPILSKICCFPGVKLVGRLRVSKLMTNLFFRGRETVQSYAKFVFVGSANEVSVD